MKKILIVFIFALSAIGLQAQVYSQSGFVSGIKKSGATPTAYGILDLYGSTSGRIRLASPAVSGTNTITFPAETGTVLTSGSSVAIGEIAVLLLPDSTHVTTPTYTAVVGDKEVFFTDDFVLVTLPTNAVQAIPVGTTINFYSYGGIMKFTGTIISDTDSIASSRANQVIGAKKVATNKWFIYGTLID